jgi:hypothetical protein
MNGVFKVAYVLLAVVLSACESRLKNGVVVDKWYEEGRIESYTYYNVALKIPMVGNRFDDEDFVLIVKGFNGKDTVKQRFEVSKTDYENTNVGDSFTFQ